VLDWSRLSVSTRCETRRFSQHVNKKDYLFSRLDIAAYDALLLRPRSVTRPRRRFIERRDRRSRLQLGHNRQREIIAGAAFVTHLEIVAAGGES
jgi:hypothetical protein